MYTVALSVVITLTMLLFVTQIVSAGLKPAERIRLQAANAGRFALPTDSKVDGAMPTTAANSDRSASGRYLGASTSSQGLGCTPGAVDFVRGLTIGCTHYDYQRNGSMNRMIATSEPTHFLSFTWMYQDNNSAFGGRSVKCEMFDPVSGVLGDGTGGVDIGGDVIPPNRSGFPSIDFAAVFGVADGRHVIAHHWTRFFTAERFNSYTFYNNNSPECDELGRITDTANTNAFLTGNATQVLWPRVAYTNDGNGTEVTHVLMATDRSDGDHDFIYARKVGTGGSGVWSPAMKFGSGGYLSHTITASRKSGSQKVLMAASMGRGDGTRLGAPVTRFNGFASGLRDNDLYYMESVDAGATWGPLTNVTQRPNGLPGGFAPDAKLDVLYDSFDNLHIVWAASAWDGCSGALNLRGRIFHYDAVSDNIRIVHDFNWEQTKCNGGDFNLNATNPQISECDGKLYVTFEQFNDIPNGLEDDCSERAITDPKGAANGDIYVTVSSNNGETWDIKRNLTSTYTPNCDTIFGGANPDCDSDVWHSATRYGIDITFDVFSSIADLSGNIGGYTGSNYLFVQYINDTDPGGAIRGEGAWTNSSVKVFRFGCVEPVGKPALASSKVAARMIKADAVVFPGTDSTFVWTLTNIGNLPATYSVTISSPSPIGNIAISGAPLTGNIPAGAGNSIDFNVTLNAGLAVPPPCVTSHASAVIIVSGNFDGSPMTFNVDYKIGHTFDIPGQSKFVDVSPGGQLDLAFATEAMNTGNANVVVWEWDDVTNSWILVAVWNWNNPLSSGYSPGNDNRTAVSNYSGRFEIVNVADTCHTVTCSACARLSGVSTSGSPPFRQVGTSPSNVEEFAGFSVGFLDSASGEFGDIMDTLIIVDSTNIPGFRLDDFPAELGNCNGVGRLGLLFPIDQDNIWWSDMVVRLRVASVSSPGDFTVLVAGATQDSVTIPITDTGIYIIPVGAVPTTSPGSVTLVAQAGLCFKFDFWGLLSVAQPSTGCCVTAGDFNHDGAFNIADVTAGIGRIFSGGAAPFCQDEADSDGSNAYNIADVTYGIARIFSGGPAPVCGTTGS